MNKIKSAVLYIATILLIIALTTQTYAWITPDSVDASVTINSGTTSLDIEVFYEDVANSKWVAFNEDGSGYPEDLSFDFTLNDTSNYLNLLVKVGNTSGVSGNIFLGLSDNGNTTLDTIYTYNIEQADYSERLVNDINTISEISFDNLPQRDLTKVNVETKLEFSEYNSVLNSAYIEAEYQYFYLTIGYNYDELDTILSYFTDSNGIYTEKTLNFDLRFDTYVVETVTSASDTSLGN